MKQYILTHVQGYGWLCKIEEGGIERYRGEFHTSYTHAMDKAFSWEMGRNQTQEAKQ